jgi:hypothetical protein
MLSFPFDLLLLYAFSIVLFNRYVTRFLLSPFLFDRSSQQVLCVQARNLNSCSGFILSTCIANASSCLAGSQRAWRDDEMDQWMPTIRTYKDFLTQPLYPNTTILDKGGDTQHTRFSYAHSNPFYFFRTLNGRRILK